MKLPLSFRLVAPYATWMILMMALGNSNAAYAVRTLSTLAVGAVCFFAGNRSRIENFSRSLLWGLLAGVFVWLIWVLPENFEIYRKFFIVGRIDYESSSRLAESSPWVLAIRLFGSAFIIPVAEELFFRSWLYGWICQSPKDSCISKTKIDLQAFLLVVVLFALEHNRWFVGAIAGIVYGLIALRVSLVSAIIAHIGTNLILGLEVLIFNHWHFW
ncbi:MAG: CAAX prenyl protease-related protein [Kiritimatiellae bacterium]|nr:CAAX prenyl protease-related protein [Kiritimatiellia bacterium]